MAGKRGRAVRRRGVGCPTFKGFVSLNGFRFQTTNLQPSLEMLNATSVRCIWPDDTKWGALATLSIPISTTEYVQAETVKLAFWAKAPSQPARCDAFCTPSAVILAQS